MFSSWKIITISVIITSLSSIQNKKPINNPDNTVPINKAYMPLWTILAANFWALGVSSGKDVFCVVFI